MLTCAWCKEQEQLAQALPGVCTARQAAVCCTSCSRCLGSNKSRGLSQLSCCIHATGDSLCLFCGCPSGCVFPFLQAIPQGLLPQRAEMVRLLLRNTALLDLPDEVGHDAVQLLDRLLASNSVAALAASLSGPTLTAACLHLVSRQELAAAPMCASVFGVQPQQLLLAISQVQAVLGTRGCVAISAMRVLQLLLERMAVDNRDAAATLQVSGRALALINRAAMVPAFIGCPPSVMAVAVLYASRLAAGLLPAWPGALAALTGYAETHSALQPYIQAAMQLLLEA